MWCDPWIIKEMVRPVIYVLCGIGVSVGCLYMFAKVTYKMHKMGIIK